MSFARSAFCASPVRNEVGQWVRLRVVQHRGGKLAGEFDGVEGRVAR